MRLQLSIAFGTLTLATIACSTPKEPTAEALDAAPGSASSANADAARASASELRACVTDDDCRAVPSYCAEAPCGCLALAEADPSPQCAGPNVVRCFANPCMHKRAQCQDRRCVIVKQPAAAPVD